MIIDNNIWINASEIVEIYKHDESYYKPETVTKKFLKIFKYESDVGSFSKVYNIRFKYKTSEERSYSWVNTEARDRVYDRLITELNKDLQ